MKLIIDIPEQIYLNAKADTLCGGDILVKAIKNGILHETVTEFADRCRECGREKVLDKIRAEIDCDMREAPYMYDDEHLDELYSYQDGLEHALNIIDKYRK